MGVSKGYDYVIVGGGSAGCVLANRLSEDGAGRVLLIEAGGRDLNPLIHVPLGTEFARTADPLYDAWIQAALAAGFPVTDDYNGKQQEGFGRGQYTIRDGYRSSAASAYLRPARKRPNLEVATRAHATRVLMRGTRASGVEYRKGGRLVRAEAEREVILSAGAFNTPPLLMLSGIGPAAHLREMGIEPVIDLPVGKNLQDHLAVIVFFRRLDESTFIKQMRFDRMAVSMIRAYLFGTGPGTVVPGGLHAFVKTRPAFAVPDIEFMFPGAPAAPPFWFPLIRAAHLDGYGIPPTLLHPTAAAKSCCARPIRASRRASSTSSSPR